MRTWNLKAGDPLSLTLASDVRVGSARYSDDQIWELSLGGGDPPSLAVHTTYGLRARSFRLFPRFAQGDLIVNDPDDFFQPPVIQTVYPNFIALHFSPFEHIDVASEIWVPESNGLAGRFRISNRGSVAVQVSLQWVAQLNPTEGQRMASAEISGVPVLAGQTDGLQPVVFLVGGSQITSGPYPALTRQLDLSPGETGEISWAHAALAEAELSLEVVQNLAACNLDAERARLDLLNSGQIDIHTGDLDWDIAFWLSQKEAYRHFIGPTNHLEHPSFVFTRLPDQGFSLRGDGSDYNHLWNGQTPLEACYLADLLLPADPGLAAGLLENFLSIQADDGYIDWKPGLSGQRSRLLATPILATFAWRIFEITADTGFLARCFPGLFNFLQVWFSPAHDRDGDGFPEWDHPMQSGSEDHPVYSNWHEWSDGVEISSAECPSLGALLFAECQALLHIAAVLGREEPVSTLSGWAARLEDAVAGCWEARTGCYFDQDRESHYSTRGKTLGRSQGSGHFRIDRQFDHPVRLLIHISAGEGVRHPQLFIHGGSVSGHHRVEHVKEDQFKWVLGRGVYTGERIYTHLEMVEIRGLEPQDEVSLFTVGYHTLTHSLLLPLWAGMASEKQAGALVERTVTRPRRFWRGYGLPACPSRFCEASDQVCGGVNLPANVLIGDGLLRYGYRQEAAELVSRLMKGIIQNLKQERAFRRYFSAEDGSGGGERNSIHGLAPLGLFLRTLGLHLYASDRVLVEGFNPYPWPVTVKYRGLTILCQSSKTTIIFPDGQTAVVDEPGRRLVTLE